jgi:hypothetical protein
VRPDAAALLPAAVVANHGQDHDHVDAAVRVVVVFDVVVDVALTATAT